MIFGWNPGSLQPILSYSTAFLSRFFRTSPENGIINRWWFFCHRVVVHFLAQDCRRSGEQFREENKLRTSLLYRGRSEPRIRGKYGLKRVVDERRLNNPKKLSSSFRFAFRRVFSSTSTPNSLSETLASILFYFYALKNLYNTLYIFFADFCLSGIYFFYVCMWFGVYRKSKYFQSNCDIYKLFYSYSEDFIFYNFFN